MLQDEICRWRSPAQPIAKTINLFGTVHHCWMVHYAQISECSFGLKPQATDRKRVISPLNHLGSSELWNLEFI
jgi:hypothetical protein